MPFFSPQQAPPGIKKNMQRTYENWTPEFIAQSNSVARAQSLFALCWFHALVQERRNYIPQVRRIWCSFCDDCIAL